MDLSKAVIVPKLSKYELDMRRYILAHDQLMEKYRQEGIDIKKIMNSHERQKNALNELKRYFSEQQFIPRDNLTSDIAAKASLIISFGGDEHFKYVSHFVDNGLIMGINSDPLTSEGVLNYFVVDGIEEKLKKLEKGDYAIEEWTRVNAELNRHPVALATSDYLLSKDRRKDMSRHVLEYRNMKEEQKSSGLLVVSGAGSTGWYDSASGDLYPNGDKFPKNADYAKFFVTEPYRGRLTRCRMRLGILEKGEELIVRSLNDDSGILTADSVEDYPFNRGAKAVIKISDKPLRVVKVLE